MQGKKACRTGGGGRSRTGIFTGTRTPVATLPATERNERLKSGGNTITQDEIRGYYQKSHAEEQVAPETIPQGIVE